MIKELMTTRLRLNEVLHKLGYANAIEGKSDAEVIEMVEKEFVSLDEIDQTQPYEVIKYELYDAFWSKHWLHLPHLIPEDTIQTLYYLLCDWKRERQEKT